MSRTVLIDADITAYQIASSQEQVLEFDGEHVLHADLKIGCRELDNSIAYILEHTESDQAALFLTGPDNFRKDILPTYKGNRVGQRRPMILTGLRAYIQENYRTFMEPTLEGDDLIGIHATMPHEGERVIYSADKDLKTVPGLHWCSDDGAVEEVSLEEADRFFYKQVLTGDPTDNYSGCPGVGAVGAAKLIDEKQWWWKTTRVLKSGPKKGEEREEWKLQPDAQSPWASILSAYRKEGLSEKDALVQARCARILRHGDYNFKTGKVNLWSPS